MKTKELVVLKKGLWRWAVTRKVLRYNVGKKLASDLMIKNDLKWLRCKELSNFKLSIGWFRQYVTSPKKKRQPNADQEILFEWLEDQMMEHGRVKVADVREKSKLLLEDNYFKKHKHFQKFCGRIRKFFGWTASGRKDVWFSGYSAVRENHGKEEGRTKLTTTTTKQVFVNTTIELFFPYESEHFEILCNCYKN